VVYVEFQKLYFKESPITEFDNRVVKNQSGDLSFDQKYNTEFRKVYF
jgi:hypothetical protein